MAADIGAVFENEIKKVFALLKTTHLVGFHRFSDTKAAGAFVQEQPSDYLMGLPEGSKCPFGQRLMFLEVKASEKHSTLPKAAVKPAQRGAIGRFRHMLGIPYFVMFWDSQLGAIQLWDGIAVMDDRLNKRHLAAQWQDCGVINKLRTEHVAQRIVDHFQIPPAAVTLSKAR